MNTLPRLATALFFAALGAAAAEAADPVVAKLGSVEIQSGELRRLVERAPTRPTLEELDRLARTEAVRRALAAEARAKGLDKRPEVIEAMERGREQALVTAYMNDISRPPASYPDEAEIQRAYEAARASLVEPRQFRLAQIYIARPEDPARAAEAERRATDTAARAKAKGADFAGLAVKLSDHPESAARRGDLGWLAEQELTPEARPAVAGLSKGEVAGPVKTAQGWHVLKLLDLRESRQRPLAEVREALAAQLRLRRAAENERRHIGDLLGRTPVTVNEIELSRMAAPTP